MSGIHPDGTLKKYPTPKPTTKGAIAAATGDLETLKCLPKSELNQALDEHGNTLLIWAADKGKDGCLTYILSQINDNKDIINARGYLGNTAIGRAARGGHLPCVQILLQQDEINPNLANEKLQYPLHFAAFKKHLSVVQCMLNSGKCDIFVQDRKGRTPDQDTSVEEIKNVILKYKQDQQF